jgi:transcription elongation factor GreA
MQNSNEELMTSEGLDRLKEQLAQLEQKLSELRLHKGTEAIYAGDMWHDNPTLYRVEAEERALMRDIALITKRIRNAKIITKNNDSSFVQLGSEVLVRFSDGFEQRFKVLGDADSNPSSGVVSHNSPLGRALMGKRTGAKVSYLVSGEFEEVTILAIN